MSDFDALFDGKESKETKEPEAKPVKAEVKEPVETKEEKPKGETKEPESGDKPEEGAEDGAPPAPGQSKNVPLAALEAERAQRQDWKEKAIRFEEQIRALQDAEKLRNQQSQGEQQRREPTMAEQLFDQRAHVSEMLLRSKHEDVDEKKAAFDMAVKENPSLVQAMLQAQSPWEFVYREGAKHLALQDFGADPIAYRKKIEDEIRAQLQTEGQPAQAAADVAASLPQSLATARSSATRTAPAHTGPRPFDDIFKS